MTTQRMRKVGVVAQSAIEDVWQRRATEAAIAAARGVVKPDGPIPPLTPIGRLGDIEWGWIVAAILFGWISHPRRTGDRGEPRRRAHHPRRAGSSRIPGTPARSSRSCPTSPTLAPIIDWSLPLASWSKETMAEFLLTALRLIRPAMLARDLSEKGITRKASVSTIARQANAAAGGPLMTPDEWDDPIGI